MEKERQKLGVVFIHLKDKWAYGSTTDSRMSKFVFDNIQIKALQTFLEKGVFKGMFDIVSCNDFLNVLNLHYDSLIKETINREIELESERNKRKDELDEAYKKHKKAQNENQPQ